MQLLSTAKINLYLDIVGQDPADGYHYIDSLFQEVSFGDTLNLDFYQPGGDEVIFNGLDVTGDTTVHKALRLYRQQFGLDGGVRVTIDKKIPMGAGLGGGSSNAAFVLMGLAQQNGVPMENIVPLGARIGSDVPFFFTGGLARVQGKGEKITPLEGRLEGVHFLVVWPGMGVETKWAYSLLKDKTPHADAGVFMNNSLYHVDFLEKIIYNKFQLSVFSELKALALARDELVRLLQPRFSFMSGSGSSLVFVYSDAASALKGEQLVSQSFGYPAFACAPHYRRP